MVLIQAILLASITIQVVNVMLFLRLIRTTRHYGTWIFLALAVGLMAIRRMVSLYELWQQGAPVSVSLEAEVIALVISLLVLIGLILIRPFLHAIYKTLHEFERANRRLQEEVIHRKAAEQHAHFNEERFRKLAEASPILIWMSDQTGQCTYFNKGWLDFTGKTLEEEKGMGWTKGLHQEDKPSVMDRYLEAFGLRRSFELEYRLKDRKGKYRWVYDKGMPMYDVNENFLGYIGSCIDITGRKAAEERLRRSEQQKSLILQTMREKLIYLDPDLRVQWTNQATLDLTEKREEELVGKYCHEVLHDQEVPCDECPARRSLNSGQTEESDISLRFGIFHLTAYPVKNNGKVTGIIEVGENITERKRAEEKLKKSEQKFREIVNTLPQFVSYLDEELKYRFVNRAYLDNFGFQEDEILGHHVTHLICEASFNEVKHYLQRALLGEKVQYRGFIHYNTGFQPYMEGTFIPVMDKHGKVSGLYAILNDVTHHVENQKLLEESRNRLQVLSEHQQNLLEKERSYIAREIHDELGQNLTAIRMGVSMIKKHISRKDRNLFSKVLELSNITQTALDQIRKLSTELRPQLIDDMGLIAAMEWHINNFEKRSSIACHTDLTDEEPDILKSKAIHLYRILQEGLTNVYKHARASNVWVCLKQSDSSLDFEISDDGEGFEANSNSKGHSYGLMGIEERVRLMEGEFHIISKNKGTTLKIHIPLVKGSH
jgi:PAS domain S-box-containing protein